MYCKIGSKRTMKGFFLLCVCLGLTTVYADHKSESELRRSLFANYDKLVRPVHSTTDSIHVSVGLRPIAIKDVDVDSREVKLHSWLFMKWHDRHLTWNPAEYGGLNELRIPPTEVWIPDVGLYSGAADTYMFPSVRTNVVLYSNGTILWVPPFTFKALCPPIENQITEDTFTCRLSVGSWTYDVSLVKLEEKITNVLEETLEYAVLNHKKWTLETAAASSEHKLYSCCETAYTVIYYDLVFKKRPETD